jgi:hypothetical protein
VSNYLEEIQKAALLAVLEPDNNAIMRKICRWFSVKFNTPLHVVEDLPKEYIYQHYFESIYEEMEDVDKHNQIIYLLETPEERQKRVNEEENYLKELQDEVNSGLTLEETLKNNKANKSKLKPKPIKQKEPNPTKPNKPLKKEPLIPKPDSPIDDYELSEILDSPDIDFAKKGDENEENDENVDIKFEDTI